MEKIDSDKIDENLSWSLADADVDLSTFTVPNENKGIVIDIDEKQKITQIFIPETDRQLELLTVSSAWPMGQLVHWIDRFFPHLDLPQAETGIYLTRLIGKLIDSRKHTLEQLTAHRYRLAKSVQEKIKELRLAARKEAVEQLLFKEAGSAVYVSDAAAFKFDPNAYPYERRYEGALLEKHYYDAIGDLNREERECAQLIASHPKVEFWVRNLANNPEHSFWIQTASDKFYPDFIVRLINGKTLVVEYKGLDRATTDDTKEKERLGELWAARSNGQCGFLMIKGTSEVARINQVISEALAKNS